MKTLLILSLLVVSVQAEGLRDIINGQLAGGKTEVVVPPGTYRVRPQQKMHLSFKGLSDVTIIADGVEMICTETTRAITIEDCTNLTIRGLTIDYDPLPFTQGKITEISWDRKSHTVQLDPGFPPAEKAVPFKHAIYSPDGTLKYGNYYKFKTEALPDGKLLISGLQPNKDGGEEVGDVVVVAAGHAPGGNQPHAVYCENSKGTVLENITLYSSPVFGFFEAHCDGSVYQNCRIDRRAGRMRSLNADAYHSKFAKKGPQIIDCTARWQGDDCINICGAYHLVTAADGKTLRVLAKQGMDIQPGDSVELITVDGKRVPDARVVSVKAVGATSADEAVQMTSLALLPRIRGFLKDAYEIKLNRSVDMPFGSVIGSMNRMGHGFAVKDCTFGNNRSRGILVKGSYGEISGNRIENCKMQAIKISPEYQWLESGYSRDVVIKNNTIINSGKEAIQIHAFGDYPAHEDIRIIGNNIRTDYYPPVEISGVDGCELKENDVKRMNGETFDLPMEINHCENIDQSN